MAGKLSVLPGETPNLSDWENHLTTIFPEVYTYLLPYLEDFVFNVLRAASMQGTCLADC